jgi:hypothetical protein
MRAPAVVSGFDNIAVVCEAIEKSGRHFGVCEDAWPFAKGEIKNRVDDHQTTRARAISATPTSSDGASATVRTRRSKGSLLGADKGSRLAAD